MKIIDAHVHIAEVIAGRGANGELRAIGGGKVRYTNGQEFTMIPPELGEYNVTPEKTIELMDKNNVEKAVLLQGDFLGFQTMYSYEAMKKYPDRFIAAATYDPFSRNRDGIVHYLFEELDFKIVKMECSTGSGLMCCRDIFPLDGDVFEREFAYYDEHNILCVIDIGKLGSESCQIEALRRVILRHSGARFVVCHLLAPKQHMEQEMIAGLERLALPNVWFDLASLQHNVIPDSAPFPIAQHFLKSAINVVGADRIMFGTDIPSNMVHNTYEEMVSWILNHPDLSQEQIQLIMHDNADYVYWNK